ncbi:MAG: diguanylate cyclase [Gammaproteobacteria bacterium]|jgi:diguanylate cyclase (GGDEF)-like protein
MDTNIRELSSKELAWLAAARFEEYRRITRWLIVGFAVLILLLWGWDWTFDPVHAPDTLWLRVMASLAALVTALAMDKKVNITASGFMLYAALLFIQVIYTLILGLLNQGFDIGTGGYLYFFLATLLLGQPFSFTINAVGCIVLTLAPHLWGEFIEPGFPHLTYMTLVWPAGAISIFLHWCVSALIRDKLYYRNKIEHLSLEDTLTGLLNRRALLGHYIKARSLATRENEQLSLIMVDIDHFKEINDTYGHLAGDQVLRKVAELMEKTFRASDTVARIGGEEFVCMLPNTGLDEAVGTGERLRTTLEQTPLRIKDGDGSIDISITISLGVTRAVQTEDLSHLINRAGKALAQAKESGRNRLVHIP